MGDFTSSPVAIYQKEKKNLIAFTNISGYLNLCVVFRFIVLNLE